MITATVIFEDTDTGEMYRYSGGAFIEYCEGGVRSDWQDMIYVLDDDEQPVIDIDVRQIANAIAMYLEYSQQDDDEES